MNNTPTETVLVDRGLYKHPQDCGWSDAFADNCYRPHFINADGRRVEYGQMTNEQLVQYKEGWDEGKYEAVDMDRWQRF